MNPILASTKHHLSCPIAITQQCFPCVLAIVSRSHTAVYAVKTTTLTSVFKLSKITGAVLTLAILVAYPKIPDKTIQLYPNASHRWAEFSDMIMGGNSLAKHITPSGNTVFCQIGQQSTTTLCGNNLMFFQTPQDAQSPRAMEFESHNVPPNQTLDLSGYKGIRIFLKYTGEHERIRFTLTNYEPDTLPKDEKDSDRIHRFMHSYAYTDELSAPIYLAFDEFKVADWWITHFHLHRNQTTVKLNNIRGLYTELVNAKAGSEHTLSIESAVAVGDWISKEHLYLTIILLWSALLLSEGAWRLLLFFDSQQASQHSLNTLKNFYKILQDKEYIDTTTQILNQQAIQLIINTAFKKGAAANIAVLIIEIDNFAALISTQEHAHKDQALHHTAMLLKNNTRKHDNLSRWGEHQFIIITEQPSAKNALQFAEKLRNLIAQTQPETQQDKTTENDFFKSPKTAHAAPITISIGLSLTQLQDSFETIAERAEHALQQAKAQGPNTCRGV